MGDAKQPHSSRFLRPSLPPTSPATSTSTTPMPPPLRSVKQRRVSLPGSNPMQSISATLDRLGPAAPYAASAEKPGLAMGPPTWGVAFRDDSRLPSSANNSKSRNGTATPASSPSLSSPHDFTSPSGPSSSKTASSYSNTSLPSTSNAPNEAPAAGAVTRRRRAATVTAKAKTKEFVANDPAPLTPVPSPPHNVSSAGSFSPPAPSAAPEMPSSGGPGTSKPRKPRKRWTMEETQALVDGCNKWGVGNWKAILNDSQFEFQGRSPVDLKDRFRTYFPDAYRHHYPNAKTHLSSRVRSFLPDGTSIFEKTRSKKRRPFSAEEDEALRLGYEKHGTTWATIVKDPVFASQERRSTDLRDRFRNAFPDLYKAAGYKPRPRANTATHARTASASTAVLKAPTESKKPRRGRAGTIPAPTATATPASSSNSPSIAERSPSARRKRTSSSAVGERPIGPGEPTALDFYRPRGGQTTPSAASTPKVAPEDIPISSDTDESSSEYEYEEEEQYFPLSAASLNPSKVSSATTSPAKTDMLFAMPDPPEDKRDAMDEEDMDVDGDDMFHDEDEIDGTELVLQTNSARSIASDAIHSAAASSPVLSRTIQDLLESAAAASAATDSNAHIHSSQADYSDPLFSGSRPHMLPHHSSASTTSLNTSTASEDWASMSSSHGGFGQGGLPTSSSATWLSNPASPSPSDYYHQQNQLPPGAGNSGGGPSRIGKSAWGPQDWMSNNPRLDSNMGLFGGNGALTSWPTPASDQHAVLDRYDLYSTVEAAHDFASEADMRYSHNHSSHTHSYPDESIFRGFTHHRYAGDLIPGSGVAVHPPSLHTGGPAVNFGALGLGLGNLTGLNLGSGIQDDYAGSVTSGSMSLANIGGLQDIDELSVVNHMSSSGAASPMKRGKEQELDLDAMIVVDTDGAAVDSHSREQLSAGPTLSKMSIQLGIPSTIQTMEEAGAITPTSLNPASLPCPPSPLRLDQARLPSDFQLHRRTFQPPPPPARPHSRSVTQGQMPAPFRPTTPSSWRDSSRSISQPPSEHRQALQRSLSYLDPIISHGASGGMVSSQFSDDPLAYSEPASISSLDLQYGMSSGPNIFTPLTMFSDSPSIAPMRTLNNSSNSNNASSRNNSLLAQTSQAVSTAEDALDLSALIHTSPIPPSRNHQRHQSQSMASPRDLHLRDNDRRKRSSWDGGLFGMLPSHTHTQDDTLFLEFSRNG